MKYIDADDAKIIERFKTTHPVGMLLTAMKHWNFQVNDVLIRYSLAEGKKNVDTVSDSCPVPKKYRVVHIDDIGMPWIKQLSVRGGMGERIICMAHVDPNLFHYTVDPEQLVAVILGHAYDPRAEYRRMRDNNPKYGSKNETK